MNELDVVREVNADEPRAGTQRLATARERLMATITEEKVPALRRRHHKVRVASWTTAGVAAAAAAVVVLVGTTQTPATPPTAAPQHPNTPTPVNAAYVLNEDADHAIHQQDEPVHPGQYRYVAARTSAVAVGLNGGQTVFAWREMDTETTWVPYDEKGIWTKDMQRVGPPVVILDNGATDMDREAMQSPRFPTGRLTARCGSFFLKSADPCHRDEPSKESLPSTVKALPRNPAEWLKKFQNNASVALQVSNAWLSSGFVPKNVRAAMYKALAMVPGIEITDDLANLDGHKGVAFGATSDGYRTDIIIDPATGQYIGFRIVDDGTQGLPKGTIHDSSSFVTGVVDKVGEVPGH